jgi:hypothetical protein
MTVLFALIPSVIALAIFVGTFRLSPLRQAEPVRPHRAVTVLRTTSPLRTPLPHGAARRTPLPTTLRA